eukprot:9919342-Alexandrium_andersonii.AAC.1
MLSQQRIRRKRGCVVRRPRESERGGDGQHARSVLILGVAVAAMKLRRPLRTPWSRPVRCMFRSRGTH